MTVILFVTTSLLPQEKRFYTEKDIVAIEKNYSDSYISGLYDTLLIKNKVYHFLNNPTDCIEGNFHILYDEEIMVLPEIDHGYRMIWVIKKDKLYIKEINAYRPSYLGYTPTKEERRERLENFLGRKFEKEGMFADFVTGKFILYKYPDSLRKLGERRDKYTRDERRAYAISLIDKQEIYTVEFKDGKLIQLSRGKNREVNYKAALRHAYGVN